jgi:tripartite-type tricarboxylate transporter receptor subunit TctC
MQASVTTKVMGSCGTAGDDPIIVASRPRARDASHCATPSNPLKSRTRPGPGAGAGASGGLAHQFFLARRHGLRHVAHLVKAGKLRGLAVTSPARWGEIPEVPTTAQAGVAGYQVSSWIGALAPVARPAAVVERLSDELIRIAQSPAFKAFCAQQSMYVDIADRRQFLAELPKEDARWKRISQLAKES